MTTGVILTPHALAMKGVGDNSTVVPGSWITTHNVKTVTRKKCYGYYKMNKLLYSVQLNCLYYSMDARRQPFQQ